MQACSRNLRGDRDLRTPHGPQALPSAGRDLFLSQRPVSLLVSLGLCLEHKFM